MKRSPIRKRNPERQEKEWPRKYGSIERVKAINALPCEVKGCTRHPRHNAHVMGGGMGRKAGWQWIVPLCAHHHLQLDDYYGSVDAFDHAHGTDLRARAQILAEEMPV